jgi:hypothetical protein
MFEFTYNKPFAIINGQQYEVYDFFISAPNCVSIRFRNSDYDWGTSAVENETTINGILQTSAQMIFDTLTNGQS